MIRISLIKALQFLVEDEHNHSIIIDTTKESGGLGSGFSPMDLLLASLTGCIGMDIVSILRKKGGKIDDFEIVVTGKRADKYPKRYLKIVFRIKCLGKYTKKDLYRAFELSRDKYCSVFATLKNPPKFEFLFDIADNNKK